MRAPRVSVVIPTYNRARYLGETLAGALGQTLADIEVIVVDDGSDDDSDALLAGECDSRLRVVRLPHTGIPGVARNAGLACARGEFVAFLDSDDVWLQDKLERQVCELDRSPSVGLVCSNARRIDAAGDDLGSLYFVDTLEPCRLGLDELLEGNVVITSSAVARRELLQHAGGFSEDPQLRPCDDYDLWLRVAACSEIAYLSEPLLCYREHASSLRTQHSRSAHWTAMLACMARVELYLDREGLAPRASIAVHRGRFEAAARVDAARSPSRGLAHRIGYPMRCALRTLGSAGRHDRGRRLLGAWLDEVRRHAP